MFGRMGKKLTYNSFFVIWWICLSFLLVIVWSFWCNFLKNVKNSQKNYRKWPNMTMLLEKNVIFATFKIVMLFVMFAVCLVIIFASFFVRCISNFSKWHENDKKMTNKTTDQNSNNKKNIKKMTNKMTDQNWNDKEKWQTKLTWQKK